jgi:phytoene/squalene synthetase
VVDEVADDPRLALDERQRRFDAILTAVDRTGDPAYASEEPWLPAVREAFVDFPIAGSDVRRLIGACRAESEGVTFATMDALESYAAAIGGGILRLGVTILGADDADSLARAERLGIGLHLVDVVRDIEEDGRMGRSYLPLEFDGLPDRGAGRIADIARRYCTESTALAKRLPNDGSRLTLLLTTDLYRSLLDGPLSAPKRLLHVLRSIRKAYTI